MSLHWAVRAGAEEPGPEGASLWDERGQSAQDLDSPAGAGDARRAGGRRASPQQRGDGEEVPWEGQARGGPASGTEQPDPCRAASRNSEERRRGRPQSGTAANLGQGTPSRDRFAQEAHRSSPDAERQRGTPSSRGHRAQRARSCSGPCQGHRSKEQKSYGMRSQAEAGQNRRSVAESGGIVTVSEFTHGLLPSTPGVKNEVGREARKRFSLNGNAGVRFGTWSQDAADSSETRAAEEGSRVLPGAQSTRVKRRAGCAQRA